MKDYTREEILFAINGGDRTAENSNIGANVQGHLTPSYGSIQLIAKRLDCSWDTANKYIKLHNLAEELRAQRMAKVQLAESTVVRIMLEGEDNNSLAAAKLVLSTTAVDLGYIEYANKQNVEVNAKVENTGNPQLADLSIEQIIAMGKALAEIKNEG